MLREQGKCKEQLAWPDMGGQKERAEGSLRGQTCEGKRRRAEGSLRGQMCEGKRKMQRQRAGCVARDGRRGEGMGSLVCHAGCSQG